MGMRIEQTQSITNGKYRPEIDGLRAFAVVAVIINHFNKFVLPGGYLGVDIFFVISGYVITSSMFKRQSKDFKDFISGFYERRIKRLVPALAVFVIITSLLTSLFVQAPVNSLKTGLASLFGFSNLYLLKESTDYFAQSTDFNVFTHTWSLGVEEQFYFLFPFLIWFSGFGRQSKYGSRNLIMVVGIMAINSLIFFLYLNSVNQPAAYFLMPSRFWEMAAGCLTFISIHKRKSIRIWLEKVPPFLIIGLIIGVMYLPLSLSEISTIVVVVLSSILLVSLNSQTLAFKFFTNSNIIYIGLISYSLYLWHWGVLSISRWTIGVTKFTTIPLIFIIILFSVLSYEFIEKRQRKLSWSTRKIFTISFGIIVLIISSTVPLSLGTKLRGKFFLGDHKSKNPPQNIFPTSTYHIMGDSHAYDIYALLLNNKSYNVKRYAIAGCDFYISDSIGCNKHLNNKKRLLSNIKKGDVVIFSSNFLPNLKTNPEEINKITQFFKSIIPDLVSKDTTIILKLPHPKVNEPNVGEGLICKKEFFRPYIDQGCNVEGIKKSIFYSEMKSAEKLIVFLQNKYPNLLLWNITEVTCPDDYCYPVKDDRQYLRDSHHLFLSSPVLSDELVSNLNKLLSNINN